MSSPWPPRSTSPSSAWPPAPSPRSAWTRRWFSFSIADTSKTWPTLRRARHIGVTVLAEHHGPVARRLAGPAASRFTGLRVALSDLGSVTLADGLAQFDTTIHQEVKAGDHIIILLELHALRHNDTSPPLVFHRSTLRGLPET